MRSFKFLWNAEYLSVLFGKGRSGSRSCKHATGLNFEKLEPRKVLAANFPAYIDGGLTLGDASGDSPYELADTFKLESNPDSEKTIYLDFNGHFSVGNDWGHVINFPRYNTEGSAGSFSRAELIEIQTIFQGVAEDYLPLDVNVTTRDPGTADLTRSGGGDDAYGVRVLITQTTDGFGAGTGGLAIRNSFTDRQDTPVFVFNKGVSNVAWTASHEAGHSLGLTHDGIGDIEYYSGNGSGETSWGPILGGPANRSLTQWSNGDYAGASNTEDDLRVLTRGATGVDLQSDDVGDKAATADRLNRNGSVISDWGTITSRDDVDVYRFEVGAVDVSLSIQPLEENGNLDVLARLYSADETLIASSNPADLVSAEITETLSPGTYYLAIDGVGKAGAYSDYGSLGFYTIRGSIETATPVSTPTPTPPRTVQNNPVDALDSIGHAGSINYADDVWRTVVHNGQFNDPVVIAEATTQNDENPAVLRIRNVTADSFQIKVQNWDYLTQDRESETVNYLVVESGSHTLEDGTRLVARNGFVSDRLRMVGLGGQFGEQPIVLSQVISENGQSAVTTRIQEVRPGSFGIELQEEEGNDGTHLAEQFSYVVIEKSSSGRTGSVESNDLEGDEDSSVVRFENSSGSATAFFAQLQTKNGKDTAIARTTSSSNGSARVFVEEERSDDNETGHVEERIGYLALSMGEIKGISGRSASSGFDSLESFDSLDSNPLALNDGLDPQLNSSAVLLESMFQELDEIYAKWRLNFNLESLS